jgi:hypothetical protein
LRHSGTSSGIVAPARNNLFLIHHLNASKYSSTV